MYRPPEGGGGLAAGREDIALHFERLHDFAIVGPQLGVMLLHDAHIVAEPGGDTVDVDASACADGSERMPHDVRTDPRYPLSDHVVVESPSEIESVAMFALNDIRLKNIWGTQTVGFEKVHKLVR